MKLLIAKAPLYRALRCIQWSFVALAASALLYCGYILADTWNFQRTERTQFETLLVRHVPVKAAAFSGASGGLLGRLDIPRLDLSVVVMEGTGGSILRRAAGHIRGTAFPGQPGNMAISGHRDTFFRPLRKIKTGDIVTFTTLDGQYRYAVESTSIVKPSNVAVLDPDGTETLTLVTCYPFYFVGSAPERFIVRARRLQ